jgi:16S rRNA (guanine966-N2)-methyltransferase
VVRIISGKLKGRNLVSFKASHLRPTTDRVKEAIFNKLAPYIVEASVLDLFSGTGNLGIESYSRGARQVVSVESHRTSIKIIKENYRQLEIGGEITLIHQDVMKFLRNPGEYRAFDIVLVDPPFTKKMAHEVMELLVDSAVVRSGSLVVIESSSQERIDDKYSGLALMDRKSYGDKVASFFEKL